MGKGLEGLLPRHLGVHREVVHIVMLEHEPKEEEGHDPHKAQNCARGNVRYAERNMAPIS